MPDTQPNLNFTGHYDLWRSKRIAAIIEWFGPRWFLGKRVLELGAGYGDIGLVFHGLGADVTFSDGRAEHVETMKQRLPMVNPANIVVMDAEQGIPLPGPFNLIVHLGVLYHLDNWRQSLIDAAKKAPFMVLETEVCDSDDPTLELKVRENGYDQALRGQGTRPSAPMIEKVLTDAGWKHQRLTDDRCNASRHVYDWQVENTGTWRHGVRRWWFCGLARDKEAADRLG